MKSSIKQTLCTVAAVTFAAVGAQFMLPVQQVAAQEENQPAAQQEQTNESTYKYIAQPGDSYSLMVRKAIQTYGIENEVDLSQAEIVMAETNLTLGAGEPYLTTGQEVAISKTAVETWATRAQAMSADEEAGWRYYVQFAEFNTNEIGETGN